MSEDTLTDEELEILNTGKCKVIARSDGSITVQCEVNEDLELGPQDVNLVSGVSKLATKQQESN